jgi:hypothetical protein
MKRHPTNYTPKTEKEKQEAYKLLNDFLKALARRQAFRKVVEKYIVENPPSQKVREEYHNYRSIIGG